MKRLYSKKWTIHIFPTKTLRHKMQEKKSEKKPNIFKVSDDDTSSTQISVQSYKLKYWIIVVNSNMNEPVQSS